MGPFVDDDATQRSCAAAQHRRERSTGLASYFLLGKSGEFFDRRSTRPTNYDGTWRLRPPHGKEFLTRMKKSEVPARPAAQLHRNHTASPNIFSQSKNHSQCLARFEPFQ